MNKLYFSEFFMIFIFFLRFSYKLFYFSYKENLWAPRKASATLKFKILFPISQESRFNPPLEMNQEESPNFIIATVDQKLERMSN